ncbi:MAG: fibronectin type III domain-containing protein [Candidatus Aenigmarchaeota archaeon]|nr:fibronectin type III domain-containing protein [Candidatus Aenigmarchaeota archaeon]
MRVYKLVLPVLILFALVMVLPSFSLSAYQWETCNSGLSCVARTVEGTTWKCHKSAADGAWKWETQTVVSNEVESNKNFAGICSDTYDNNCNALVDSLDTNDCVPPSTSLTSVAGDTVSPYYDTNSADSKTDVVISGESGMSCRWDSSSHDYSDSQGTSCSISGSSATCAVNDATAEGAKTRYVACKDSNENKQSASQARTVSWTNDWTGTLITFNQPASPTGLPYDMQIVLFDIYTGVDKPTLRIFVSNNGGADIDITSSFSSSGNCQDAGVSCTYTRTINGGDAEATDGTHKLTITVKDNVGNSQSSSNTYTYTVSTCKLDSVTIAPSSACNKDINQCTAAGTACNGGNAIDVTAKYSGLACPDTDITSFIVQVDAKTSDSLCNVQGSGGQMAGISITCSNAVPSASQKTCTGTWTLPALVPPVCQNKAIIAKSGACDASINGIYCTTPSGSFGACKDTTTPIVSIALENGNEFKASRTITATSLSGKDNTYGLGSCNLNWGDAAITTKTCGGAVGEECASQFSSTDKQHTYSSDGSKTATFSCTNKNSITGSSPDSLAVCTSIDSVTNLKAYGSSSKTNALSDSAWQNDNTPYFEWSAVTSLCGVKYDVQVDTNPATTITTNSYTPGTLSDGKHTIKVTSKDGNNLGLSGTTQTFNLWVDTASPTTYVTESIPAWFSSPVTLHLSCSDASSSCASTTYCLTDGCTPSTSYTSAGISLSASTNMRYQSSDNAGNTESVKQTTINIDTTAPTTPSVTDGGSFTASTSQLAVSWTASTDAESGITEYQYSVGTTAGGTQTLGYTSAGLATSATISGLNLVNGNTYYINVRAKNGAGSFGTAGSSDGIKVVTDGPSGLNGLSIERTYGNYISGQFAIFTGGLSDVAGVDTTSCSYTKDGTTWLGATWNSTDSSCKKAGLGCTDGDTIKVKMRASNTLGTLSETSATLTKTCDASPPELQSFVPVTGTTLSTASKDLTFSTTARDLKSGLAKLEWTLFYKRVTDASFSAVGIVQKVCDGGEGVSVTCNFKTSDFVDPAGVKTGDKFFVRVRGDDHIDPWSPTGDSGQWSVDETAPDISSVTPTLAVLGAQQDYSANVKATEGRTISSCDLSVNGVKIDDMILTSGTSADGTWTGQYTISAPSIIFMRAHCVDNAAVAGDGLDVQISLATTTISTVVPSIVDKLQITNITANYKLGATGITGAQCWVLSSDYNDPSKGIVGVTLADLNNGYYTYSFPAPSISGTYNYAVSCAKTGYQTTTHSSSFAVRGCDGPVCIRATPGSSVAILTLGQTQTLNLALKNRDDFARTYSITLSSADPKIFVDIAPAQVTLNNGEEKTVAVGLTSLAVTDQQVTQNIIVKNTDPSKPLDVATSGISISVAISAVPGIGAVEVAAIFVLAALVVYVKSGSARQRRGRKNPGRK